MHLAKITSVLLLFDVTRHTRDSHLRSRVLVVTVEQKPRHPNSQRVYNPGLLWASAGIRQTKWYKSRKAHRFYRLSLPREPLVVFPTPAIPLYASRSCSTLAITRKVSTRSFSRSSARDNEVSRLFRLKQFFFFLIEEIQRDSHSGRTWRSIEIFMFLPNCCVSMEFSGKKLKKTNPTNQGTPGAWHLYKCF